MFSLEEIYKIMKDSTEEGFEELDKRGREGWEYFRGIVSVVDKLHCLIEYKMREETRPLPLDSYLK